ncbi:hypothetical protein BU25DRAFT_408623 [Macroventuria anomochaeta]|uniref:Uncharacterized protein n=1 Tax=Macroventuria anomochaeta TaxID=301207 RepID=A0ACB6S7A7_9PLEO|nr:uncharacterized protein BU25DRAFT_408623 [Macroventuria anomochaeta]KAF2630026.1 hypothetical protein BU25DRAFT_408623 [Macroventuria anomochaeta]
MQTPTTHILLAATLPLRTTLAQNTTTDFTSTRNGISQLDVCCLSFLDIPYISSPNASVESVGSVPFLELPNQDPWHLFILVNDTGPNLNGDCFRYTRESFLSVPNKASNTSVCLYQFTPLNTTNLTNGSSCAGVFSDECMLFMQEMLSNATISEWRPDNSCPDPFLSGARLDRLLELCGRSTPNAQLYSRESACKYLAYALCVCCRIDRVTIRCSE